TQVAASLGSRAFVKGGSLYVCVPGVGAKNAGPWTKGLSKVSMYGPSVVWTQRSVAQGLTLDRVWAFAYGRTWLRGVTPTKGAGSDVDIEVRSLKARGMVAAWVTGGGQLVQATDYVGAEKPLKGGGAITSTTVDREVNPLGAGTPGAAAPTALPTDPVAVSLFAVQPAGGLLTKSNNVSVQTVGRWPAYAGEDLAATLRLDLLDDGDADDCGGARSYGVTVNPVQGAPAVGWRTSFSWQTSPC
ncbi:MAG: hypothetical protein Q7T55_19565, partial [Solirubrobacteraceae bacterium]|nr:hypothetical protein [Solirubrobacteraceae bacterium]